ncbi:pseudouridine synthase, partial [Corynespora cassiicola Philippines]
IIAINKPQWASSAGVLRDIQTHFANSPVFTPWIEHNRRKMILDGAKKKHIESLKVKVGHGGTLDPLATGVLIVGLGKGTKCLQRFLDCTKSYECVVLFGAATDSYDAVGKVVSKAPYEHVTKELVEEKLKEFRGTIMQKPSIFSALKVDGKKMYEYAREGKDIPEVAAREVKVEELELVEWLEPGTHEYKWPKEEADGTEQAGAEKLMGIRKEDYDISSKRDKKRARTPSIEDDHVEGGGPHPKKPKTDDEPSMSGALPKEDVQPEPEAQPAESVEAAPASEEQAPVEKTEEAPATEETEESRPSPPAARLRMTVTSGFYVRSLCHDLGLACNSLGLMSSLIRSRQGDYELGKNVLEFTDLEKPEEWEPKVSKYLEEFMEQEGWSPEELETEEEWQERKQKVYDERRERGDDRASRGGGGKWRGGGRGGRGGKKQWNKGRRD